MLRAALVLVATAALPHAVLAHGGGLDANGCHHDRKNGGYHCHRAAVAPTPVPTGTSQQALAATPAASVPLPPNCYVGPRGGTYTITKSGKKNYGGC